MQRDFHFCGTAVLARAAGFVKGDALTIAYASQYVDDATESEPIRVGDLLFDPARTAHYKLKAYDWAVQKRIYMPFHFIPPKPFVGTSGTFVTEPGSSFAHDLLDAAFAEPPGLRRLCRIGIALHTFADTWAHQGFSGRHHEENDVESIYLRKGDAWDFQTMANIYLDFMPQIGHAEAATFPDLPHLTWKYTRAAEDKVVVRNNPTEFLAAAEAIHARLAKCQKSPSDKIIPWDDLRRRIETLLGYKDDVDSRCWRWRDEFRDMFTTAELEYSSLEWRNEALNPKRKRDTQWDALDPSDFSRLAFPLTPGFADSKWVHFHRAALKQRHYVLENLL